MAKAIIKCPHSSTVISVTAGNSARVRAGDTIAVLDSSAEQDRLARLIAHETKLKGHLAGLMDDQEFQRRQQVLQDIVTAQTHREARTVFLAQDEFSQFTLGHSDLLKVFQREDDWAQAKYDLDVAVLKQKQYPKDLDHTRRHLATMIDLVTGQKQFVHAWIDRMTIKAPIDGTISLFVGVHTPVHRGHVIGEIA